MSQCQLLLYQLEPDVLLGECRLRALWPLPRRYAVLFLLSLTAVLSQPLKKLSILSTFSSKGLEHGLIVTKNSKFTPVVSRYLDPSR